LRDREREFLRRNVTIAVVTFEHGFLARAYAEDTRLRWPILVDETRETYRGYGMLSASLWDVWGPRTWWACLKALLAGQKLRGSEGDLYQRGGDVLIAPDGTVALHHVGVGPGDRPTAEKILERIPAAAG
jgi:peroxiredoxin